MTVRQKKRIKSAVTFLIAYLAIASVFKFFFNPTEFITNGLLLIGFLLFVWYILREVDRGEWWDIEDEQEEEFKSRKVND